MDGGSEALHALDQGVFQFDEESGRSNFQWDADSRRIWTATQEQVVPNGWALTPLRPALADLVGGLTPLPELTHAAGPLDALYWIDGHGRALAQFGTRGQYYRPQHPDPEPTLAYVDAAQGQVLDSLTFSDIGQPLRPGSSPAARINHASAVVLADGRMRSVLQMDGAWIVWTQGEPPRRLDHPYDWRARFVLSPEGASLIALLDHPAYVSCDRLGQRCMSSGPVEGRVAAMHDLATGAVRWTLEVVADHSRRMPDATFSPDGRLALVGVPTVDAKKAFVVLDAETGAELQRVGAGNAGDVPYSMGFTAAGDMIWVSLSNRTIFYHVE